MTTLHTTEYHLEDRARRLKRYRATNVVWTQLLIILFGAGVLLCGALALILLRMGGCL